MNRLQLENQILNSIQKMAEELIEKHLAGFGWTFKWDRAKRRMVYCRYLPKKISLSSILVFNATKEEIRNTILHEIAHALAGYEAGHGYKWKRTARSIGCNGETCHSIEIGTGAKYSAKCSCRVHYKFRKPKYGFSGYRCLKCKTGLVFQEI